MMIDILEEHFEELDFLWELREGVIFASDWKLEDLIDLEERADAHLDGLHIGAEHSIDIARPWLAGEERGAATAATFVFMSLGRPEMDREVLEAFASAPPPARRGIRIGLRHSDIGRIATELTRMAATGDPSARAAAADVLGFHRLPAPPRFADLLSQLDSETRVLFYGAAGRFGGPWSVDYLEGALQADSSMARRAALEASARLGLVDLPAICRRSATRPQDPSPEALAFLGVVGESRDLELIESCLTNSVLAPAALSALGSLGSIRAVPGLIRVMSDLKLADDAGAAFCRLTGAGDLAMDSPPHPPADLSQDERDLADGRRPPDPERALAWWNREKGRFAADGRWQAGLEVGRAPLGPVFKELPLGTRYDLYLRERSGDVERTADLELERRAKRPE